MKRSEREARQAAARIQSAASPTLAPKRTRAGRIRRAVVIAGTTASVLLCLVAGYYYAAAMRVDQPARQAMPQVVEGDGAKGPKGMLWVPGGEFLMGSDHKLAQKNERPA